MFVTPDFETLHRPCYSYDCKGKDIGKSKNMGGWGGGRRQVVIWQALVLGIEFAKIRRGGRIAPLPPCSNGPERQTSLMLFILCYIFLYIQESKCCYTSLDGKMLPIAILLSLFVTTSTTWQLAPRDHSYIT